MKHFSRKVEKKPLAATCETNESSDIIAIVAQESHFSTRSSLLKSAQPFRGYRNFFYVNLRIPHHFTFRDTAKTFEL